MNPPLNPTPEMIEAAVNRPVKTDGCCLYTEIWKAMYAAGVKTITEEDASFYE